MPGFLDTVRFVEPPIAQRFYSKWQALQPGEAGELKGFIERNSSEEERTTGGIRVEALLPAFLERLDRHMLDHLEETYVDLRPPRSSCLRRLQATALFYSPAGAGAGLTALDEHVDNADVTVNLCLCPADIGGQVEFTGNNELGMPLAIVGLQMGEAVAHAGALPHSVREVAAGERVHLIVQYVWSSPEAPPPQLPHEKTDLLTSQRNARVGTVDPGLAPAGACPVRLQVADVAQWLDPATLGNLCEVSRACYGAFTADALWEPRVELETVAADDVEALVAAHGWRGAYLEIRHQGAVQAVLDRTTMRLQRQTTGMFFPNSIITEEFELLSEEESYEED